MNETFLPKSTVPRPLDIVWGRFPYAERPGLPGPVCHPCLVLQTNEFRPGCWSVLVVFGTSNTEREDRHLNLTVSNVSAQIKCGLNKDTLFCLGRYKRLPWSEKWFSPPDSRWATPKIGRLPPPGPDILRETLRLRERLGLPVPPR